MTVLIPYLIKLSVSLAVVYLFYHLFLRRLTFYNWNRWYLLIYSFLSFFIPFVNIYPVLEKNNWDNSGMLELIPVVSYQVNPVLLPIEEKSIPWTYQDWTMLLIGIGAVIMLGRLLIQQASFIKIRRSSTLLLNDRIKVYQVDKNIIPFSYGNSIFVNQHQHSQEELKEIIRHEFIHVKQKHTLDILCAELLCIFNWYNPFAWLIRKSIRQNLEFIADNKVLQNGIDKKEYQYLLLKVIGVSQFSVATQFNFSSLKKRIAMMNKIKSAKVHLIKFLFLLPLMAVLLLAFRNKISDMNRAKVDDEISYNVENSDLYADVISDTVPGKRKLPENVSQISINNDIATVKLKNGKVEKYNLNSDEELIAFEKKYGKWIPPSPPLAPSKPAKAPAPPLAPTPRTEEHVRVEQKENSKGYIVTVADNNGECVVIIKDKNKKIVKAMLLTEWNDNESENAAKYGEIPSAAPTVKAAIPAMPVPANPPVKGKVSGVEIVPVPAKPSVPARPSVPAPGFDDGIIIAPSQEKFYLKPDKPIPRPFTPSLNPSVRFRNMNGSGEQPLFIIDGVRQPVGEQVLNKIDPEDIERIDVIKDASARAHYGEQAAAGVILIKTKSGSVNKIVTLDLLENFEGLIILDGEEVTKKQLNERIKTEDIESMNVLKNEEATKAYGEKGKNGVMIIRTKTQKDPVIVSGVQVQPAKITIFKSDHGYLYSNEPFHGIYIIDGNEYSEQEYNALQFDPNTAKNVNCYSKGQATVNRFGERGRNGVMVISTQETRPGKIVSSKSTTINRTVAGIIIDQETRKPIAGVKVYSTELGFETTTDKNGYYLVHINKQATVLPRILMAHPQYLSAMMFDGSYDKQMDIDHTLVLFMGMMHKDNPKGATEYSTSSFAQQYTLTTNKTPGYDQLKEILTHWLKEYDHQRDRAQNDKYIDRVNVNDGVMNWDVVKDKEKHPLYLLEGKPIGKDIKDIHKHIEDSEIYGFEGIAYGDILKKYGKEGEEGVINFITKANKDKQSAYLIPQKKISEEELATMLAEAAKLNVLYVGIENPLKIHVENIPANELEVELAGGIVYQRNGVFYAIPQNNEGGNSKIDIYKKLKNGQTQLLNSRYFRVRALPQQNNIFLVSR